MKLSYSFEFKKIYTLQLLLVIAKHCTNILFRVNSFKKVLSENSKRAEATATTTSVLHVDAIGLDITIQMYFLSYVSCNFCIRLSIPSRTKRFIPKTSTLASEILKPVS